MGLGGVILGGLVALSSMLYDQGALPPSGAHRDRGGSVIRYASAIDELKRSQRPYVAPLHCVSACTMLLDASNVCWRPNGILYFHSASLNGETSSIVDPYNRLMADYYPREIARWFLGPDGPGGQRSTRLVEMRARDLIASGLATACP